jgi:translation initiation factor IF-3
MRFANSQKKAKPGKVRQQKLKELRLRPKTGDHDLETKAVQARKFLEHNDRVQISVIFRGREMQHVEEGRRVLDEMIQKLSDVAKIERPPAMDGKRMTAMLMPAKPPAKSKPKPKSPNAKAAPARTNIPMPAIVAPDEQTGIPEKPPVEKPGAPTE